uniref:Uncharacterized protein n=1 Tax=Rhizophora mucronata TaxID=61149 RepID=A0A2P2PYX0_RHIMU
MLKRFHIKSTCRLNAFLIPRVH